MIIKSSAIFLGFPPSNPNKLKIDHSFYLFNSYRFNLVAEKLVVIPQCEFKCFPLTSRIALFLIISNLIQFFYNVHYAIYFNKINKAIRVSEK